MGFSDIRKLCKIKVIQLRRIDLQNQLATKQESYLTTDQIQRSVMNLMQALHKRNDIFGNPYPGLSAEKQTALVLIKSGYSYRETAKELKKNHTIITQWSKNDPKFKQALEQVKTDIQESIRMKTILPQLSVQEMTSTSQMNEELEDPSL